MSDTLNHAAAGELPPLPKPSHSYPVLNSDKVIEYFTAEQFREGQRTAIAADRSQLAQQGQVADAIAKLHAAKSALDREQGRAAGSHAHVDAANQYQLAVFKLVEAALAAPASAQPAPQQPAARVAVPDGYVLVPKTPTPEMIEAFGGQLEGACGSYFEWDRGGDEAYTAMLAASSATVTAPECGWCNDSGIIGSPPDQYETCPYCIERATVTEPAAPADGTFNPGQIYVSPGITLAHELGRLRAYDDAARNPVGEVITDKSYGQLIRWFNGAPAVNSKLYLAPVAAPAAQQAAPTEPIGNVVYERVNGDWEAVFYDYDKLTDGALLYLVAPATVACDKSAGMVGQDAKDAALRQIAEYQAPAYRLADETDLDAVQEIARDTLAAQQAQASAKGESNG